MKADELTKKKYIDFNMSNFNLRRGFILLLLEIGGCYKEMRDIS